MSDPPVTRPGPEALVEAALTAWRPRNPHGRILASPAWADLDEAQRRQVFEDALTLRRLEQALDSQGLSTTARAVLDRIEKASEA